MSDQVVGTYKANFPTPEILNHRTGYDERSRYDVVPTANLGWRTTSTSNSAPATKLFEWLQEASSSKTPDAVTKRPYDTLIPLTKLKRLVLVYRFPKEGKNVTNGFGSSDWSYSGPYFGLYMAQSDGSWRGHRINLLNETYGRSGAYSLYNPGDVVVAYWEAPSNLESKTGENIVTDYSSATLDWLKNSTASFNASNWKDSELASVIEHVKQQTPGASVHHFNIGSNNMNTSSTAYDYKPGTIDGLYGVSIGQDSSNNRDGLMLDVFAAGMEWEDRTESGELFQEIVYFRKDERFVKTDTIPWHGKFENAAHTEPVARDYEVITQKLNGGPTSTFHGFETPIEIDTSRNADSVDLANAPSTEEVVSSESVNANGEVEKKSVLIGGSKAVSDTSTVNIDIPQKDSSGNTAPSTAVKLNKINKDPNSSSKGNAGDFSTIAISAVPSDKAPSDILTKVFADRDSSNPNQKVTDENEISAVVSGKAYNPDGSAYDSFSATIEVGPLKNSFVAKFYKVNNDGIFSKFTPSTMTFSSDGKYVTARVSFSDIVVASPSVVSAADSELILQSLSNESSIASSTWSAFNTITDDTTTNYKEIAVQFNATAPSSLDASAALGMVLRDGSGSIIGAWNHVSKRWNGDGSTSQTINAGSIEWDHLQRYRELPANEVGNIEFYQQGIIPKTSMGAAPPPKAEAGFTRLSNGHLVMYGGITTGGSLTDNVHISSDNGTTWTEQNAAATGTIRKRPVLVAVGNDLILFGGVNSSGTILTDMRISNDSGATWNLLHSSSGIDSNLDFYEKAVVYDKYSSKLYVLGGYDTSASTPVNTIYECTVAENNALNATVFSTIASTLPQAISHHSAVLSEQSANNAGSVFIVNGQYSDTDYSTRVYMSGTTTNGSLDNVPDFSATWTLTQDDDGSTFYKMSQRRRVSLQIKSDGRLVAWGGHGVTGYSSGGYDDHAIVWESATNGASWSPRGFLLGKYGWTDDASWLLDDNSIVVAGGKYEGTNSHLTSDRIEYSVVGRFYDGGELWAILSHDNLEQRIDSATLKAVPNIVSESISPGTLLDVGESNTYTLLLRLPAHFDISKLNNTHIYGNVNGPPTVSRGIVDNDFSVIYKAQTSSGTVDIDLLNDSDTDHSGLTLSNVTSHEFVISPKTPIKGDVISMLVSHKIFKTEVNGTSARTGNYTFENETISHVKSNASVASFNADTDSTITATFTFPVSMDTSVTATSVNDFDFSGSTIDSSRFTSINSNNWTDSQSYVVEFSISDPTTVYGTLSVALKEGVLHKGSTAGTSETITNARSDTTAITAADPYVCSLDGTLTKLPVAKGIFRLFESEDTVLNGVQETMNHAYAYESLGFQPQTVQKVDQLAKSKGDPTLGFFLWYIISMKDYGVCVVHANTLQTFFFGQDQIPQTIQEALYNSRGLTEREGDMLKAAYPENIYSFDIDPRKDSRKKIRIGWFGIAQYSWQPPSVEKTAAQMYSGHSLSDDQCGWVPTLTVGFPLGRGTTREKNGNIHVEFVFSAYGSLPLIRNSVTMTMHNKTPLKTLSVRGPLVRALNPKYTRINNPFKVHRVFKDKHEKEVDTLKKQTDRFTQGGQIQFLQQ